MEKLNVRFSRKVNLQIDDFDKVTSSYVTPSMIARAAMQIGLNELKSFGDNCERSSMPLDEFIVIQNLKAKN